LEVVSTSSGELEMQEERNEPDIDFTKALEHELPNIFAPPKNLKSLLFPTNKATCSNKLPEDCHYQPESLVKLFLLPDVLVMFTCHKNCCNHALIYQIFVITLEIL
jgi:condensin complex subunit 2